MAQFGPDGPYGGDRGDGGGVGHDRRGRRGRRGRFVEFLALGVRRCFAHSSLIFGPLDAGDEKTHDRFQPWVFVENLGLASTNTNGIADYDDLKVDLSKIANHGG